jgi:queuine tRNA-ribosyltransferase
MRAIFAARCSFQRTLVTRIIPDPWALPPCPSTFPAYEPKPFFRFEIIHRSRRSSARIGRLHTPHGTVETPAFVAVGTNAALKMVDQRRADEAGLELLFCNTYHLLLQPGPEIVTQAGGLHRFMQRSRPIMTDSGGFQVFSLAHGSVFDELNMKTRKRGSPNLLLAVSENGPVFRSYRDGRKIELTPEKSVQAQKMLGADIIIPLDELPPYHIDRDALYQSVLLSHRWEARSLREHLHDMRQQAMYAVIHGGIDLELRRKSVEYLTALPFDGIAIGGSLGKDREELLALLAFLDTLLPKDRPVHLLGIADEESIRRAVPYGIDTFDSCYPTRAGRHGTLLTRQHGRIQIKSRKWERVFEPVDTTCEGFVSQNHTLAYLHHLWRAHEPLAAALLTLHNIKYMCDVMREIRTRILADEL